jgi:hypothetical protein
LNIGLAASISEREPGIASQTRLSAYNRVHVTLAPPIILRAAPVRAERRHPENDERLGERLEPRRPTRSIGFTNGIAILIASTQIKDFLGLKTGAVPSAKSYSFNPSVTTLGHVTIFRHEPEGVPE